MIYKHLNRYNYNIIVNYLNDSMEFKMYTLFKIIDFNEDFEGKVMTLAIDGKVSYLVVTKNSDIGLRLQSGDNTIFGKIDLNLLKEFLIVYFRDKTIDNIIQNG